MHVKFSVALSRFRMVCNAIAAAIKGTLATLLDRISKPSTYCRRSDKLVHTCAECKLGPSNWCGLKFGCRGRRRYFGVPVSTYDGPLVASHEYNGEGSSAILHAPRRKSRKQGSTNARIGHKGRRWIRSGPAKYTPKRQTVPVAITGICEYPHAYFPDGTAECFGGGCGAWNWERFTKNIRKARRLDRRRIKGARTW